MLRRSVSAGKAVARVAPRLSGRVEDAVLRHGAPGWQQQAGAGERHRRWQSAPRPRSGHVQSTPACTPGTWRHEWILRMKQVSWFSAPLAVYGSGIAIGLSGRSAEQASAGSTVSARIASAVIVSVRRRHRPFSEVGTSVRTIGSGGRQRQEGNGRSDAVRLLTSGMLRRVRTALRGTVFGCSNGWSEDLRIHGAIGTSAGVGKRSEPFPDRDAICPDPQSGANRRGGGNPRGRNTMRSGWSRRTEGRWQHQPGVNAQGS